MAVVAVSLSCETWSGSHTDHMVIRHSGIRLVMDLKMCCRVGRRADVARVKAEYPESESKEGPNSVQIVFSQLSKRHAGSPGNPLEPPGQVRGGGGRETSSPKVKGNCESDCSPSIQSDRT